MLKGIFSGLGSVMIGLCIGECTTILARHFNMISDFGKALDPLADKLTQGTLLLCLLSKYELMCGMIVIFAFGEITKFTLGIIIAKKHDQVIGAKWYGKANTVVIYMTMMLLILFPQMNKEISNALILLCGAIMIIAHALYFNLYIGILLKKKI